MNGVFMALLKEALGFNNEDWECLLWFFIEVLFLYIFAQPRT